MSAKLTIITSTLNCKEQVGLTALSLAPLAKYSAEWVVVDGGSSDGTTHAVQSKSPLSLSLISELDDGIYDAWNKALAIAEGEWLLFLGAGDILLPSLNVSQLSRILAQAHDSVSVIWGGVYIQGPRGITLHHPANLVGWEFGRQRLPHHQGCFLRRSAVSQVGGFDKTLRIAGDTKNLMLLMKIGRNERLDDVIASFRADGVSYDENNIGLIRREIRRINAELEVTVPTRALIIADLKWCAILVRSAIRRVFRL